MLREDLLNEMVERSQSMELVDMFMSRIVAYSPNAAIVKDENSIVIVQKMENEHENTISVRIANDGIYKVSYKNGSNVYSLNKHFENVKQVILDLLYECVYDITECNNIIEFIYGWYFEDVEDDEDDDDISILLEEERDHISRAKITVDPEKLKREIRARVYESVPDNYTICVTAYWDDYFREVQIKVEKVEPTLDMYNEPDEVVYCHMVYRHGIFEVDDIVEKEVHNECWFDEAVEFLLSNEFSLPNTCDRILFEYLGPEFTYEYFEEYEDDADVEENAEESELDAYLSDMSDAYEDVDDDDLPF